MQLVVGWGPVGAGEVRYDGSYQITDVEAGTWRVVARLQRSGRQAEGEVTVDPEAGESYLDLDFGQGLRLSGLARRNGQPLAGATIQLYGSGAFPALTESDPAGHFAFEGLPQDVYRLEVSDFRTGLTHSRNIDLRQDEEIVLDLATAPLVGVVLDVRDRRPLAQAEVEPGTPRRSQHRGRDPQRAVTALDGSFAFPEVVEGSWRITAEKAGYARAEQTINVMPDRPAIPVELLLGLGKSLQGGNP